MIHVIDEIWTTDHFANRATIAAPARRSGIMQV